jgi:predicted DNA-binding transcriptional regulator YafY
MKSSPAILRIHRCVWLYARLASRGSVDYRSYHRRFRTSVSSYYRDLAILQHIGVRVESIRDHGTVAFVSEAL